MKIRYSTQIGALALTAALALSACSTAGSGETSSPPVDDATHDAMDAMDKPSDDAMDGEAMDKPSDDAMEAVDPADVDERLTFEAMTVSGDSFEGIDLAGKDSILWFWASWCPSCMAEAPLVADAISELPEGVTLYGVPGKSDQGSMEAFVADYGLEDIVHIVDGDGTLWPNFGVPSQPAFTFINDDGNIRTVQGSLGKSGILDGAADLAAS